jgi:hypothetical protein
MTSEPASQALSAGRADDVPSSWDERTTLTTFLAYARGTVHVKCAGLSDADARRAPLPLDAPSRGALAWRDEPVTLRWILFHLTEETARHNGHLDILRELVDGTRGI